MIRCILNILLLFCFLFPKQIFGVEKLTVILDWFPNPNHAPLFVAQQEGFYKQQGLDVSLIGPANPADGPKLVAANKADIAVTYEPQLILDQKQGLPLTQIGTLISSPLGCLAVSAKSNIDNIKDLKGKTIGYSTAGIDIITLGRVLKSAGLSLKDVKIINVNYNLTQALMTHRVDAITGIMRNFEVIQMELAGFPVRVFYPENYGVPAYPELIYVANINNFKTHQDKFSKFLEATKQGEDYLQKHPKESWKLFAINHPELHNELNKRAWFVTLPYFAKNPKNTTINPAIKPNK